MRRRVIDTLAATAVAGHAAGMRMQAQVRRARANDAAALQELYQVLVPGDPNIHVDATHLAALESDPFNQIWVVEAGGDDDDGARDDSAHDAAGGGDGRVCGTAFLTICRDAMYRDQPFGTLENVVLHAHARGKGLGRALFAEVERAARAARCTKLMLLSSSTRREAHAFFAHLGFDGDRKRGFVKYLNRPRDNPTR